MASIDFDDVSKRFPNGTLAVDEMNLTVDDGEFMIFVGPSGCGKTTALRMVAGLEEVTSGSIRIGDRVVNDVEPPDRDIAMVFQNYALYPHMSVADNMGFPLRMQRMSRGELRGRVHDVAELLGIGELLARKPRELSGGQRQRVAMGRAIVRHPQVFLMDEPLSNLDAKLRVQMRADIAKLQHDLGTTTIYVTHDQVEAMTMGDRVAVMSLGVLQQVDTPQRLYEQPANLFVAGFIGTPPMNLVEAGVATHNGTVAVKISGQDIQLSDATLARYPGVRRYDGRSIVFGVRSDDLYLPQERPNLPSLTASLQLVEQLGSHSIAYFKIDAHVIAAGAAGLEGAVEEEGDAEAVTASRPNLVASFSAAEAAALRLEDEVPVAIDVAKVHLFDSDTGEPLR